MAKKFDPKAKAKRQKIILAVLGVVFIGVLAWQVPSVLKLMNEKPPTAATTPAPPPAPVSGVTPGTSAAPGTPVSSVPAAGELADSDPAAQAAGGQLVSFDRFASKDPFVQQAGIAATPPPPSAPPKPASKKSQSQQQGSEPTPPSAPATAPTSARISVNGSPESVSVGGTFPQADPLFVLVSVTTGSAKIGVSGGSLDSGGAAITLKKGKKLTLENTVDGARYVLVLLSTG